MVEASEVDDIMTGLTPNDIHLSCAPPRVAGVTYLGRPAQRSKDDVRLRDQIMEQRDEFRQRAIFHLEAGVSRFAAEAPKVAHRFDQSQDLMLRVLVPAELVAELIDLLAAASTDQRLNQLPNLRSGGLDHFVFRLVILF